MKCLDRFKKKMQLNGGSLRNEYIYNNKMLLNETFEDDASFPLGVYFWELGVNDYDQKEPLKIRFYNRRFSAANGTTMKFQTLYDTPVVIGDIIYCSKSDEYWICTEVFDIDSIHWQGKFTKCNWMLKWQKKDTGEILIYPCYDINSTQYNSGETANRIFTIGTSQHMLTLPCDENTVVITTPQRFYLDKNTINPTSFIVTQNDTTSYNYGSKGLVKITVTEHPNDNEHDRPDLGICDYIDISKVDKNNSQKNFVSKAVISYDTTVIKSGGDSQFFVGKFYDDNGLYISDIQAHWSIVSDFTDKLKISQSDNQIGIGIDDDSYVDEEFKLILSDESGQYSSSLVIQIESLL